MIAEETENPTIEKIQAMRCTVCEAGDVDAHHVTTRGAGGTDELDNLMPLCRVHHIEWHQIGPGGMIEKYREISDWLRSMKREDIFERVRRVRGDDFSI